MASIAKEIILETENTPGMAARVTAPIKEAGVNIMGICGWGDGDKGHFMIVTEDSEKAGQALKNAGFNILESEVLLVDLKNEPGTFADLLQKLGDANVNINYCYVSGAGPLCLAVLATQDNAAAMEVL